VNAVGTVFRGRMMRAAAFFGAVFACYGGSVNAQVAQCPTPANMTIQIFNNSQTHNIYPVLSVGQGPVDEWMQAWCKILKPDRPFNLFPRTFVYRLYIAPTGNGIPAGGSVKVTLPLYTQLAGNTVGGIDPTKGNQSIDWWQGGGIRIFQNLKAAGKPPAAFINDRDKRSSQIKITATKGFDPSCVRHSGQPCNLIIVRDTSELPLGDPFQLTEYTLGAVDTEKNPWQVNTRNVDYDVSYVDSAFMPVLMEPYPNNKKIWGWVGINDDIASFDSVLDKFLTNYKNWPQFVDNTGTAIVKIPSPLNIFISNEVNQKLNVPARADLTPLPWTPIQKLLTNWQACQPDCQKMQDIAGLLSANYDKYVQNYFTAKSWNCDTSMDPVKLTELQIAGHVYGWSPYLTNCLNAAANQLYETPGYFVPGTPPDRRKYQLVKDEFDALQYTKGFDPYVDLIHGADYLNAPYAYAYSVDDAVGNVQVNGATGFIIAVGSTDGLPNPNPLNKVINVSFGYGPKDAVRFTEFGVCTTTPDEQVNPSYASFESPGDDPKTCPISFVDNKGQKYNFTITKSPPFSTTPNHSMIDCTDNDATGLAWCQGILGHSEVVSGGQTKYLVVAGAPQQPPP
jgi:hypothetical protein